MAYSVAYFVLLYLHVKAFVLSKALVMFFQSMPPRYGNIAFAIYLQ